MLPLLCTAMSFTLLFKPVPTVNVLSNSPFSVSLAIRFLSMLLYLLNKPPIIILPSGCRVNVFIVAFAPKVGLKFSSIICSC